jgi:hypothetical protein
MSNSSCSAAASCCTRRQLTATEKRLQDAQKRLAYFEEQIDLATDDLELNSAEICSDKVKEEIVQLEKLLELENTLYELNCQLRANKLNRGLVTERWKLEREIKKTQENITQIKHNLDRPPREREEQRAPTQHQMEAAAPAQQQMSPTVYGVPVDEASQGGVSLDITVLGVPVDEASQGGGVASTIVVGHPVAPPPHLQLQDDDVPVHFGNNAHPPLHRTNRTGNVP